MTWQSGAPRGASPAERNSAAGSMIAVNAAANLPGKAATRAASTVVDRDGVSHEPSRIEVRRVYQFLHVPPVKPEGSLPIPGRFLFEIKTVFPTQYDCEQPLYG